MKSIKWYNLNEDGYIVSGNNILRPLSKQAGIYTYKLILNNEEKFYIGSTINMFRRFSQHRYRAGLYKIDFSYSNYFYEHVRIYGWNSFKYGIIKNVNLEYEDWANNKEILFNLERKYLDKYNPSLNMNKVRGSLSPLKKREEYKNEVNLNISNYNKSETLIYIKPEIKQDTLLKLKLHNKNITVSIYNKSNELIQKFDRIKKAAEFVGLNPSTVSGYLRNGKLWNNLYYFKLQANTSLKDKILNFPLDNYDVSNGFTNFIINKKKSNSYLVKVLYNDKIIYQFESVNQASKFLNISKITLIKYYEENKLWKNKFEFKISINL